MSQIAWFMYYKYSPLVQGGSKANLIDSIKTKILIIKFNEILVR